jgi:hypothetical protein
MAEEVRTDKFSEYVSGEEAIDRMLSKLEKQLISGDIQGTVADYLRLIQVRREITHERPREIEIRWLNSIREGCAR